MLKKHIIKIIELTTYISFGTLIACAVWYLVTLLSRGEPIASASMPYITLWEIPLLGFLCAVGTDIAMSASSELTANQVRVRIALHYVYINAVVLICGYFFGWYELTVSGVLLMLLTSAVIYAFTFFFTFFKDIKTADKMNRRLKDYKEKGDGI